MKNVKKIIGLILTIVIILGTKISYAATQNLAITKSGNIKYLFVAIGMLLITLVLFISYKSDRSEESDNEDEEDDDDDSYELDDEENYNFEYENEYYNENNEETSLYDSVNNVTQKRINKEKENFSYNNEISGFKFDDIFKESISDFTVNQKDEINSYEKEDVLDNTEESVDLENDFIMQMNKNLAPENFVGLEDYEVEDIKNEIESNNEEIQEFEVFSDSAVNIFDNKEEPKKKTTRKTTAKKAEKEEPKKKTTRKTTAKK